jgi:hypothetical protein
MPSTPAKTSGSLERPAAAGRAGGLRDGEVGGRNWGSNFSLRGLSALARVWLAEGWSRASSAARSWGVGRDGVGAATLMPSGSTPGGSSCTSVGGGGSTACVCASAVGCELKGL